MPDFWTHSGYHLAARDRQGRLVVTSDLLRAYFARPEVAPLPDSCAAERGLSEALLHDPRRLVSQSEIDVIVDPDARQNYRIALLFRDRLVAAGTLESAYANLFVDAAGTVRDFAASGVPPMFVDQLAQIILRNILDGCEDGLEARAAEIFFREQRASVDQGQILVADLETVELQAAALRNGTQYGNLGRLVAQAQTPLKAIELDVLDGENAALYWTRDERHDTAMQLNFGRAGCAALCRVIEAWIVHFTGIQVQVLPTRSIDSSRMRWYVGLDRNASALLNDIYNGIQPDPDAHRQLLVLMELRFPEYLVSQGVVRDVSVTLALAMDEHQEVRMKPQNLLINLPIRRDV